MALKSSGDGVLCRALLMLAAFGLVPAAVGQAPPPIPLTVQQAEAVALKNNPAVTIGRLNALVSRQVKREVRSALFPQAAIDLTGVDSLENSRIDAGGLNNPIIFERAAGGTTVSQLITDFGRTTNLLAQANLQAKAEDENAIATAADIVLAVDRAFYTALQNQALLVVAQQTVSARQTVTDQVQALTRAKLRSDLDLSFASVNLAEANLLLLDAQNNYNASLASLSAVLGYPAQQNFELIEDKTPLGPPPTDVNQLIAQAFARRPELASLDFQYQAADKFRTAERDLMFPTVRALGAVGGTPVGNPVLSKHYGAVGVNVEIPVFNGFLFSARAREADLRAQAAEQRIRDMRNNIARDVRTTWLNADAAYRRLGVSQQLLGQANLALDLSQTRYNLGLASIVEVSQAQLQQTQAQISYTAAQYQYRLAQATLQYQIGH